MQLNSFYVNIWLRQTICLARKQGKTMAIMHKCTPWIQFSPLYNPFAWSITFLLMVLPTFTTFIGTRKTKHLCFHFMGFKLVEKHRNTHTFTVNCFLLEESFSGNLLFIEIFVLYILKSCFKYQWEGWNLKKIYNYLYK